MSSLMGSVGDNGSGGMYGYRTSKTAVNQAGVCVAKELQPRGILCQLLHPGFVNTDMTAAFGGGGKEVSDVAGGLVDRMAEATMDTTGKFLSYSGKEELW